MPWIKGQSGNPAGGPKDKPLTDSLRRKLFENERKRLNDLVDVMYARAMSGDMQAILAIADRLEGKPVQQIEAHNVNENHYVRAPAKATEEEWKRFLKQKTKPVAPAQKTNVGSNGKSH